MGLHCERFVAIREVCILAEVIPSQDSCACRYLRDLILMPSQLAQFFPRTCLIGFWTDGPAILVLFDLAAKGLRQNLMAKAYPDNRNI